MMQSGGLPGMLGISLEDVEPPTLHCSRYFKSFSKSHWHNMVEESTSLSLKFPGTTSLLVPKAMDKLKQPWMRFLSTFHVDLQNEQTGSHWISKMVTTVVFLIDNPNEPVQDIAVSDVETARIINCLRFTKSGVVQMRCFLLPRHWIR